jgi:hypothetical protein
MSTIIDGSAGITFPNSTIQASAGSVIQVVSFSGTPSTTTTSSSFVSTGLTASITPKFSTSKILVLISAGCYCSRIGSVTDFGMSFAIYRNSTQVFADTNPYNGFYISTVSSGVIDNFRAHIPTNYLDSPATTSSTAYTLYINAYQGNANIGQSGVVSTITLMEIAG